MEGAVICVTLAMVDIVKRIKETCTILGYADDWVIVTNSKVVK
jgi:hypothetical protein